MNPSAMIYVADGSTAQALSTTAAKMTGFAASGHNGQAVDGDNSVKADHANDQLVIGSPGVYLFGFQCSGALGTANTSCRAALRKGTTEITHLACEFEEDDTDTGAEHSMSFSGPVALAASDFTDGVCNMSVYVESLSGTPNFTPVQAQFWAVRLA